MCLDFLDSIESFYAARYRIMLNRTLDECGEEKFSVISK